ncbi:MAG: two-component regulator propeller domain-containing protein [Anaerolineae bacterium]
MNVRFASAPLVVAAALVLARAPSAPASPIEAAPSRVYLPITARLAEVGPPRWTSWTAFTRTRFNDLAVAGDGTVFASTDDGVLRWASTTGEQRWLTRTEGVPDGPIGALAVDRAGNLWLAAKPLETAADASATTGVRRLAPDGTWRAFTTADGLAGNAVYAIEVDPDGRVWVAAWHGVNRLEPDGRWATIRNEASFATCPVPECMYSKLSIAFGGGTAWFGYATGVSTLRADGTWLEWNAEGPVRRIAADRMGAGWFPRAERRADLWRYGPDGETRGTTEGMSVVNDIDDLLFDGAGRLWVGGGTAVTSLGDGEWRTEADRSSLPSDQVHRLAIDPSGHVWAALAGALTRLNGGQAPSGPTLRVGVPLARDEVRAVAADPDGGLWLGVADNGTSVGGLVRIAPDGRWTSRGLEPGTPDAKGVREAITGPDGTLWATDGRRLLQRRSDGQEVVHDSGRFGPRSLEYRNLVVDGAGALWAALDAGDSSVPGEGVVALLADGTWLRFEAGKGHFAEWPRPIGYDRLRGEVWFADSRSLTARNLGWDVARHRRAARGRCRQCGADDRRPGRGAVVSRPGERTLVPGPGRSLAGPHGGHAVPAG